MRRSPGVLAVIASLLFPAVMRAEFQTPTAIVGVRIVGEDGVVIPSGTILMERGKIVAVGDRVDIPPHTERIDGAGMSAYPGFIDAHCHLGMAEPPRSVEERSRTEGENLDPKERALPATHAANRRGIRAQLRALDLYKSEAKDREAYRNAGFTGAVVAPRDGLWSGVSALIQLAESPLRDAVVRPEWAMHASYQTGEPGEYPETLLGVFAVFRQVIADARWHGKLKNYALRRSDEAGRLADDEAFEALQPVLSRSRVVVFEANTQREIHRAMDLAAELGFDLVISGGKEAYKVVDRLKKQRVGVIASIRFDDEPEYGRKPASDPKTASSSSPKSSEAPEKEVGKDRRIYESLEVRQDRRRQWDEQVDNVSVLRKNGIHVTLRTRDFKTPDKDYASALGEFFARLRLIHERGLSESALVDLLSHSPARMLGVASKMGRMAAGQAADIVLWNKPFLEKGASVRMLIIDGKRIDVLADVSDEKTEEARGASPDPAAAAADSGAVTAEGGDSKEAASPSFASELRSQRIPKVRTGGSVMVRNATILPVSSSRIEGGSVLIENGRITGLGVGIATPDGVFEVDGTGLFVVPGFVDCHSHLGVDAINEAPMAISAEVRMVDVIDPESVGLYRALAGGATTHHVMHGSANPIGGQNVVLKLKYTRPVSEMVVTDAPRTIKFALGENVKQSNFPSAWDRRFPNSRMGVEATMRSAFARAVEYQQEWDAYDRKTTAGEDQPLPRRDLRLEALSDILRGEITIHCHCYRSDEVLRLFSVAEDFGIRIGTLHHILEGYRIAPEIARHGCGASTFSNFWAFKVESYGAVPHNAAMMTRAGVNSSVNSDSPDTIRYLGQEAAKSVRWGALDETEALKLVTLNPAQQLQIAHRVGSLEVGKDGDLALFNAHPFHSFGKCVMTIIEGEVYFDDREKETIAALEARIGRERDLPPSKPVDRSIPSTPHRAFVIQNATVHPMAAGSDPSTILEGASVVILDDRIHAVGREVEIPPGAGIIQAKGLHVYPGLIDGGSALGLSEFGAVRSTEDQREIGEYNPDLIAGSAVHPHSEHMRVTRAVGVTTAVIRPVGGRISGQGSIFHLDGWTASQMSLEDRFALYVNVPSLPVQAASVGASDHVRDGGHQGACGIADQASGGFADEEEGRKKQRKEHAKTMAELDRYFERATHYARVRAMARADSTVTMQPDAELEAMAAYATGEKPVVLAASTYKQILDSLDFAEKHKLRPILMGGAESWKLAERLATSGIAVILSSPTTYPSSDYEPWDSVYRCATILHQAGVRFCFSTTAAPDAYNMPIEVGMAVAHGLPLAVGELALTRSAAEILGLAKDRGSIEIGKKADLIVTTHSPLQAVNQVTHQFIDGRPIDLGNLHLEYYDKFLGRPKPALPPARDDLKGPKSLSK